MNTFSITPETIPSLLLVVGWFFLLRRLRNSNWSLALVSLVGTTMHEAAHGLVGWLAKPVSVSLWPRREGNMWILGSVSFTGLNIWNSAFVAFAPLLLFGLSIALFFYWMVPAFVQGSYLSWILAGYVVTSCLFSGIPSGTDVRVGFLSACLYTAAGVAIWTMTK